MSLTWTVPVWMWPLLLVLAAGAVIWAVHIYRRTRPAPRPGLARLLVGLRSAAMLLLVLAVAGPVLSRLYRQEDPARLVVVLEDSASMGLEAFPSSENPAGGGPSRWASALSFAAGVDSALQALDWPGETIFLRGNGLEALQDFRPGDPVVPDPAAHGTDLNQLLRQVRDRTVGLPTRAVLLFSDGQETRQSTGPADRPTGPAGLTSVGPLVVVGAGDPAGSADRLVKDLRYPDTAFAGDEVVAELAVTHRFLEDEPEGPVTVTLTEDGRVLKQETVPLQGLTTALEIPFSLEEEGLRVFELEVSPLDNERFLANNKVSLAINVRRGRSRLLVLAQQPGWDVRFLSQAALAETRLELAVVHPTAGGMAFADSLVSWKAPADAEGWNRWDGLVLFGWQGMTGNLDWEALNQAVGRGLGLLVMPGPSSPRIRNVAPVPAGLAELLPIEATRLRWIDGDFFARIPAGSAGHPVLHLVDSAGEGLPGGPSGGLGSLPPLRRVLGVEARAGALTLLEADQSVHGQAGARVPLLVADNIEMGRAAWFGGQRLWELAFWEPALARGDQGAGGLQAARRLVQNLLVWLAAGQEESGLVFSGRRGFYQEGERIKLSAQWRDMRGQPVRDRALTLALRPLTEDGSPGSEQTFAMERKGGPSGPAEVLLPPLPPGTYSIQLVGQGDPPVLGAEEFLVVTAHSVEQTQVRQDRRRLQLLAGSHGGSYHQVGQEGSLAGVLDELTRLDWSAAATEKRDRLDFWSGWPFLLAVATLLGLEWYLRRRNGML